MLVLKKKQEDFADRGEYLLYVAINFINTHARYETAVFDEAECDGACLIEDIQVEFDVPDHLIES